MGVLMRGVDMPKNCEECNFKGECRNYWAKIRDAYTRPSWCPLVEVSDSEKPNNCETKICDICRYYNNDIPCGSTPSACKEADKFAEEFVDGLKKLKPKDEPQTERSE